MITNRKKFFPSQKFWHEISIKYKVVSIKYNKTVKNFLIFILAVVVIGGIVGYLSYKKQVQNAGNFDECTKIQGAVILESYPAQCRLGNKTFTQNIGNELEVKDLITISSPRPNQTISSPLNISGKARGTWFFEASFPIKLVGENGKTIAQTAAQAQGSG